MCGTPGTAVSDTARRRRCQPVLRRRPDSVSSSGDAACGRARQSSLTDTATPKFTSRLSMGDLSGALRRLRHRTRQIKDPSISSLRRLRHQGVQRLGDTRGVFDAAPPAWTRAAESLRVGATPRRAGQRDARHTTRAAARAQSGVARRSCNGGLCATSRECRRIEGRRDARRTWRMKNLRISRSSAADESTAK